MHMHSGTICLRRVAATVDREEFTPELLRSKREQAGLLLEVLAQLANLKPETIEDYESGWRVPSRTAWRCIRNVLNMSKEEIANALAQEKKIKVDTWVTPTEKFSPKIVTFKFEKGHCYSIKDAAKTYGAKFDAGINPKSGNYCIFRYEGKQGIHHKFMEIQGGWTRTYTDQQLIGKIIKEVGA